MIGVGCVISRSAWFARSLIAVFVRIASLCIILLGVWLALTIPRGGYLLTNFGSAQRVTFPFCTCFISLLFFCIRGLLQRPGPWSPVTPFLVEMFNDKFDHLYKQLFLNQCQPWKYCGVARGKASESRRVKPTVVV